MERGYEIGKVSREWGGRKRMNSDTMKIFDISQEVLSCEVFPDDPVPQGRKIKSMEQGELYNLSVLSMCAHNGTHIDAPAHFLRHGKTVEQLSIETFVGKCFVVSHQGNMTGEDAKIALQKAKAAGVTERILIAGDATVTADAAKVFAASDLTLIGNESQTVGPKEAPMEVHLILLNAGIVLLEGIVLKNVAEGTYFLSAAPLNFAGFEGAPCRAYLIKI